MPSPSPSSRGTRRRIFRAAALAGALGGLATLLILAAPADPKPVPANLVLISLDTTRADHLGCYGYSLDTSPTIDRLARESVFFEQAFTHAVNTVPAHASLFTGLYPSGHGSRFNAVPLNPEFTTLTNSLAKAGYRTGAFVSGYTMMSKVSGFQKGFEIYDDEFTGQDRRAEETVTRALAWMKSLEKDRPYFLFVHLFDPHGKYEPPEEFIEKFKKGSYPAIADPESIPDYQRLILGDSEEISADPIEYISRYDGEINYSDSQIARLLEMVDKKTLIVFTADHGESLLERDHLFGHGIQVNEEAIRVPLIMRFPEVALQGKRISGPAQLIDVLPTVLSYLGRRVPRRLPGTDLLPYIRLGKIPSERPVIGEGRGAKLRLSGTPETPGMEIDPPPRTHTVFVRQNRYKLIRYPTLPQPTFELFDLVKDPGEKADLAPTHPDLVAEVYRDMDLYLATGRPPALPELDEEAIEKLRSLGYID